MGSKPKRRALESPGLRYPPHAFYSFTLCNGVKIEGTSTISIRPAIFRYHSSDSEFTKSAAIISAEPGNMAVNQDG